MAGSSVVTGGIDPRLGNPEWRDNWTVGPGLRVEVVDALSQVWLCQEPVTVSRAHGLALPDGASLFGPGQAVADLAYFRRSPGATADGPLDTMEIDGLRFSFVAQPVAVERVEDVTVMSIDKHHTMLYCAGRAIEVIDFGDGTVATPAWTGSAPIGEADLPNAWTLRTVELDADLVAVIPNPASVVMVGGFGFHGPIPISHHESTRR